MSVWALATDLAIWTLIVGSVAVFAWFLVEVVRLVREDAARRPDGEDRQDRDRRGEPGP